MTNTVLEFDRRERILQTLAVIALIVTQAGSFLIFPTLFCYLIFYTRYWWICVTYICWYIFIDKDVEINCERKSEWVRSWTWWLHAKNYFPVKLVKLPRVELDPKKNYLFGYFPHGIFSTGAFLTLATSVTGFSDLFPYHKPYIHSISIFFKIPLLRELGIFLGGLSASAPALDYVLGHSGGGNVSGLIVGGAAESYYCKPGVHKIVYEKRKGFIKLALKHGSPLVPVYCFGETDLYSQLEFAEGSVLSKLQHRLQNIMGFALLIPVGAFGLLPHRRPVTVVVGEPIDVPQTDNPTQQEIDTLHQTFGKKLIDLFESQKMNYLKNYENVTLEIT